MELLEVPATCEAEISIATTIDGGETTRVNYSLKALSPTADNSWEEVKARITTAEGVTLDQTIYFYSRTATGKLVASTRNIVTTMTKGQSREYSLQVTNQGQGNTGRISLSLPDFIKSLAGNTLPALEQNNTLTIALSLTPTDEMQLNVPVTGQLGINCENGDGTSVSFNITPVSESTGTLVVDVTDENTYYTQEAPHLADAEIVVRNPVTNALVTQGRSGEDGKFTVELPEGYYKLSVTADKHDSYTNNIYVDPGVETVQTINLSINAISVTWDVVETEVEDEYEIVTTVSYETNVPVPVVVMNAPDRIDGDNMQEGESVLINVLLTNKGLITANEVEVGLPTDLTEFSFTPLSSTFIGDLPPQQTVTVPVVITKLAGQEEAGARVMRAPGNTGGIGSATMKDCMTGMALRYKWVCGKKEGDPRGNMKSNSSVYRMALKDCATAAAFAAIGELIPGKGAGGGLFEFGAAAIASALDSPNNSNNSYSNSSNQQQINTEAKALCDPETSARAESLVSGLIGFLPTGGLQASAVDWGLSATIEKSDNGSISPETYASLFWIAASGYACEIKTNVDMPKTNLLAAKSVGDAAGTGVGLASMIAPDYVPDWLGDARRLRAPRRIASWMQAYDAVAYRYCDELYASDKIFYGVKDEALQNHNIVCQSVGGTGHKCPVAAGSHHRGLHNQGW